MKDYLHFTATQLALDEDFIRWVQTRNPEDDAMWQEWLRLHPDRSPMVDEAVRLVRMIQIQHPEPDEDVVNREIERLLRNIGAENPGRQSQTPRSGPSLLYPTYPSRASSSDPVSDPLQGGRRMPSLITRAATAAAIIAMVVGVRYLYLSDKPIVSVFSYGKQIARKRLIEKINDSDKTDSISLSDGSRVWIGPHSRISYAFGFDTARARDIYLSGQAVFEVAKHPLHPFRVISGEVVTKVLGTRFCVRSFDNDSTIQVIVRSGKVSVYTQASVQAETPAATGPASEHSTPGSIILTCNQRVVYQKNAQKFQKSLLEQPSVIAPDLSDDYMTYDETPVQEVFGQLSKVYGIGIMYDAELLKHCTVTADLRGEDFYKKLDLICRAIGASYEVVEGQVFIQSAGCQGSPSG